MKPTMLAVLLLFATGVGVEASETQWWTWDSPADHARSEVRGLVIRPDGAIETGLASDFHAADSLRAIWALAVLSDGSVALAGDRGRIDRWTPGGGVRPWARLGAGQVLSLIPDGDGVIAGTGPRGVVYRIGARGDTSAIARTGERYVWGLAPAGRGAWWAATGTKGRLLRIEKGVARVVFDSDESNLVALAADGRGGVYAGGDSKGRIVHVSAAGEIRTLFDAAEDEVRALAVAPDGAVWAAALSASAVSDEGPGEDDKMQPVRTPPPAGRAVVYRIVPDSVAVAWWTSPQPLVFALAPGAEGLWVATGNRAGLHRVERPNQSTLVLAPSQGQLTALAVAKDGGLFAGASNAAGLWRVGPSRAGRGELLSGVMDARRFAAFGQLRWSGRGDARFRTRSGNTDSPDTTWSAWREAPADAGGVRALSPPARYAQWELALSGTPARVEEVALAWRERNLPPRLDELVVAPQGQSFRDGDLGSRSEAVTQTLPSGQKVEYSLSTSSQRPIRELPAWARGLRTVQWRGTDPNGDLLRYRAEVRLEGGERWLEVGKNLESSVFTWNTATMPDGRYRLRVTASDALANAIGEEGSAELTSEPFTVDNTAPAVTALSGTATGGVVRVEGTAEDASSPLSRLEASFDDGDWRTIAPEGGLTDRRRLTFTFRWPGLAPGEHVLSVRAVDLAGNSSVRAIRVLVDATRPSR